MFKNYYSILGITYPSTPEEINKAFRKQAMRWHPDHNQGVDTTTQMQEIIEAYTILKDEESRRLYNYKYEFFLRKGRNTKTPASTDENNTDGEYTDQICGETTTSTENFTEQGFMDYEFLEVIISIIIFVILHFIFNMK